VREDQLSLAIGRRGQNVRLASKLSGWDIEIMTQEELAESIDRAVTGFSSLAGVDQDLADKLVEEGFLSYDDLSIIEPDALMQMGGLTEEQVAAIVEQAESLAEVAEAAATEARRQKREQERKAAVAEEVGEPIEAEAVENEEVAAAGDDAIEDELEDSDEPMADAEGSDEQADSSLDTPSERTESTT